MAQDRKNPNGPNSLLTSIWRKRGRETQHRYMYMRAITNNTTLDTNYLGKLFRPLSSYHMTLLITATKIRIQS